MPPTLPSSAVSPAANDVPPPARPFLDAVHGYVAQSLQPILGRCRLRIFRNRAGHVIPGQPRPVHMPPLRSKDSLWAVVITEMPAGEAWGQNPGLPARLCLTHLANEIKRLYLVRAPLDHIAWFYHQPGAVSGDRPKPHDQLCRIDLRPTPALLQTYQQAQLGEEVSPEDLELAAGGMVDL